MNRRIPACIVLVLAPAFTGWSQSSSVLASASNTHQSSLSANEIREAQKLYVVKCAKCHKFYDPNGYSQSEWNDWMAKMAKKSRLKPTQTELLSRFLEDVREGKVEAAKKP